MNPGTRVLCVKDHPFTLFDDRAGRVAVPVHFPKEGDEFTVYSDDRNGCISLCELNYGMHIFYWEKPYFTPVAPLEEEIHNLLEELEPA